MLQDPVSAESAEYTALPAGERESPAWQAARELDLRAQDAQGRLDLGCCLFWLDDGGYLLTALPPMGDVRGGSSHMTLYTAKHLINVRGKHLHRLAWAMKEQRIDNLAVTAARNCGEEADEWVITSITAAVREDD